MYALLGTHCYCSSWCFRSVAVVQLLVMVKEGRMQILSSFVITMKMMMTPIYFANHRSLHALVHLSGMDGNKKNVNANLEMNKDGNI